MINVCAPARRAPQDKESALRHVTENKIWQRSGLYIPAFSIPFKTTWFSWPLISCEWK